MSAGTFPVVGFTLREWRDAYRSKAVEPSRMLEVLSLDASDPTWICVLDRGRLEAQLEFLSKRLAEVGGDPTHLPLYGIPFAVKDNIDVEGWPTTAACPAFERMAVKDAEAVRRLREAGAIVVGKTNLDQFATGLVGTRSPYGAVPNPFDPERISGGSSSGSGVAVGRGLVPFALGTDTAGSGRVPAGFNNVVGLKPTKGWISCDGVLPACRSLDCVSVFALTVSDALEVAMLAQGEDPCDPYSRKSAATAPLDVSPGTRLAVPDTLEFFGDALAGVAFESACAHARGMGCELVPVNFAPFRQLAALLYQGSWIAERYAVLEELLNTSPDAVHPVVRGIVESARDLKGVDVFRDEYRRAALSGLIARALEGFDALLVPTAGCFPTIADVMDEPVKTNSELGFYTNFANLADLCALALPGPFRPDGLPAGVTLLAPAWHDLALASFGKRWEVELAVKGATLGATGRRLPAGDAPAVRGESVRLAVVGAHLRGMPLNHQLTSRGARFVEATMSAPEYRLFALAGTVPSKPGLARVESDGRSIALEVWDVPLGTFGAFVAEIPPPLGIGSVTLASGAVVKGFICEGAALATACDISEFGGWRDYLDQKVQ